MRSVVWALPPCRQLHVDRRSAPHHTATRAASAGDCCCNPLGASLTAECLRRQWIQIESLLFVN
jgi:hypothetical protein